MNNNNSPILHLEHVGMSYNTRMRRLRKEKHSRPALKDVSMELFPGETIGIIGRNGAGKSTLLRIIAGIIDPDTGHVHKEDISVRLLGLSVGFLQELSAYDNLILGGLILGLTKKQIAKRIDEILDFAELQEVRYNPICTFSSGMVARLAFSLAVSVPSDVLLIDELMGVGDCSFQRKSGERLKEMIKSDVSCIIVSHSPGTILELCSRVVWIEDGVTIKSGATEPILDEYREVMLGDKNARRL